MPKDRYEPTTGAVDAGTTVRQATAPAPAPLNPVTLLPLGIVLGGLGYLLWGRPGRLATADRQGLTAQLVGRPAKELARGPSLHDGAAVHHLDAVRDHRRDREIVGHE